MWFILPNPLYDLSSGSDSPSASVIDRFVHGVDAKREQADDDGVEVPRSSGDEGKHVPGIY